MRKVWISGGLALLLGGCATGQGKDMTEPGGIARDSTGGPARVVVRKPPMPVAVPGQVEAAFDQVFYLPETGVDLRISDFNRLSGWAADDHAEALATFRRGCAKPDRFGQGNGLGPLAVPETDWQAICAASAQASDARQFFEEWFRPVEVSTGSAALLTGYYEPEMPGSRVATPVYRYPVYARPREVTNQDGDWGTLRQGRLQPYLSRGEIDAGALRGRGLELMWFADPVEVFFLHIQGSGRARLPDGRVVRLGFAAKNGHPYVSIGQRAVALDFLPDSRLSAQSIKEWVRRNPRDGQRLLAENPSFVFFRPVEGLDADLGPPGAMGVQLTAERSVAVDRQFHPQGAPIWIEGEGPRGPIRRLMVAQDTGGAIKGAQRADLFFGSGHAAGDLAGVTRHQGRMWTLLPARLVRQLVGETS